MDGGEGEDGATHSTYVALPAPFGDLLSLSLSL